VAIHVQCHSLTALHEFGHALSSYTNGSITDRYVDSDPAVNNKHGHSYPLRFGDSLALSPAGRLLGLAAFRLARVGRKHRAGFMLRDGDLAAKRKWRPAFGSQIRISAHRP
jgi:hypothetical protein